MKKRKLLEEEAEAQRFIGEGSLRQACEGKISQAAIDVIVYAVRNALNPPPVKKKVGRR